jgi:hypothetical protein
MSLVDGWVTVTSTSVNGFDQGGARRVRVDYHRLHRPWLTQPQHRRGRLRPGQVGEQVDQDDALPTSTMLVCARSSEISMPSATASPFAALVIDHSGSVQ